MQDSFCVAARTDSTQTQAEACICKIAVDNEGQFASLAPSDFETPAVPDRKRCKRKPESTAGHSVQPLPPYVPLRPQRPVLARGRSGGHVKVSAGSGACARRRALRDQTKGDWGGDSYWTEKEEPGPNDKRRDNCKHSVPPALVKRNC